MSTTRLSFLPNHNSQGQMAPYQIELAADGGLIFAPADDDNVVRVAPGAKVV